jgi:signal transduction histidine kinase
VLWLTRETFEAKAAARGITINADQCPIGVMAAADEGVFGAMMQSLVDNAVTFIQPGGQVTLSVAQNETGIVITVADNGQGVSAEDLQRILEPFEHAGHAEAAQHSKGAGLGLTVVKAFAELHGGKLELASTMGEGFTATVTLPPAPPFSAT